jgi:hypothetical protein
MLVMFAEGSREKWGKPARDFNLFGGLLAGKGTKLNLHTPN